MTTGSEIVGMASFLRKKFVQDIMRIIVQSDCSTRSLSISFSICWVYNGRM